MMLAMFVLLWQHLRMGGMGVNFPNVKYIVHMGPARNTVVTYKKLDVQVEMVNHHIMLSSIMVTSEHIVQSQ